MGCLRETGSGRRTPLRAHHTLGRSADTVDTVVSHPAVSRIHAVLEWQEGHWQLRDLSRNGCWMNGRRLPPNEAVVVPVGARLAFGDPKSTQWALEDASEPRSLLLAQSGGGPDLPLTPYLFLPDEVQPELVVYYSSLQGEWLSAPLRGEEQLPAEPLRHDQCLEAGGRRWRAFLADSAQATAMGETDQRLNDFQFQFRLSLDEECTELCLRRDGREIDLGERSHHYLLLQLARHRCEEAEQGVDNSSQGWVDTELLARELGVDLSHLNILIFRARKQLAEKLVVAVDSEQLVERRKGQVRFGCPHFTIHKGDSLTHEMRGSDTLT